MSHAPGREPRPARANGYLSPTLSAHGGVVEGTRGCSCARTECLSGWTPPSPVEDEPGPLDPGQPIDPIAKAR